MVHYLGHGDTQNVILLPGSINECFEFGWKAFDLAERLQWPIYVLSDLDFGMNHWMAEPFEYPDQSIDRGKVLWEQDLEELSGKWARYKDVDGDGIPYRTIPGNKHPTSAWFARGTGHNENAVYTEDGDEYERNMARLKKKYETAKSLVPKPVVDMVEDADIGIIAYGSTLPAVQEARHLLAKNGLKTDLLQMRAIPFSEEVTDFIYNHERSYVVEMNRDGQLHQLLSLEYAPVCAKLTSVAHLDGLSMTARFVEDKINQGEAERK
jgi:2-oxoglutarate ferredoxin oxidoreductase subunit alpha